LGEEKEGGCFLTRDVPGGRESPLKRGVRVEIGWKESLRGTRRCCEEKKATGKRCRERRGGGGETVEFAEEGWANGGKRGPFRKRGEGRLPKPGLKKKRPNGEKKGGGEQQREARIRQGSEGQGKVQIQT